MNQLKFDVLAKHLSTKLDFESANALSQVDKATNEASVHLFKGIYEEAFGELATLPENRCIVPLIQWAKLQPNTAIKHNIYSVPKDRWQRWKWLAGIENGLDKRVQKNYDEMMRALEQSQPKTIMQLKRKLTAFWHVDRQLSDFKRFRRQEKKRDPGNWIDKVAVKFFKFLRGSIFRKSMIKTRSNLEERSKETCAIIGKFTHGEQVYEIRATHGFGDKASPSERLNYDDETHATFYSLDAGWTKITIHEQNQPTFPLCTFEVTLCRPRVCDPVKGKLFGEHHIEYNVAFSSKRQRYLMIDQVWINNAADGEIKKKAFQIFAELGKQCGVKETLFRESEASYLSEAQKALEERRPDEQCSILEKNAGVLPEYWARKLNSIDLEEEEFIDPDFQFYRKLNKQN